MIFDRGFLLQRHLNKYQLFCDINCNTIVILTVKQTRRAICPQKLNFCLSFLYLAYTKINVQSLIFWCDVNNFSEMNYVKFEAVQEISEDNPSIAQGLLNNRYHCKLIQKWWLDINWLRTIEKLDQFSGFDELMTLFTK